MGKIFHENFLYFLQKISRIFPIIDKVNITSMGFRYYQGKESFARFQIEKCLFIFSLYIFFIISLFNFPFLNIWFHCDLQYIDYCAIWKTTWQKLLNPHDGYIKSDAYLQQLLSHMSSDVKFSRIAFSYLHCFEYLRQKP